MPIVTPGKRPGVRLSKSKVFGKKGGFGKKRSGYAGLNLTPMVDMMTIIVIYLLQNFSAEGNVLAMSEEIQIPKIMTAGKIKKNPQIGVEIDRYTNPDAPTFLVSLEGNPLFTEKRPLDFESPNIPELTDGLQKIRDAFEKTQREINSNIAFDGNVNIQADMDVPFKLLKKVMGSCAMAGYGALNFAGVQSAGGGGGGGGGEQAGGAKH